MNIVNQGTLIEINLKTKMRSNFRKIISSSFIFFFLALPASTNYKLKDYGFGTGGTSGSSSPNYSIEAITGEVGQGKLAGSSYGLGPGLIFTNQANVPGAPTFTNPANYYNRLQIILNTSGNPTDTKYAIAISSDNFATTSYVQSDNTVGSILGAEDYQIYSSWGGVGGVYIIGLAPGTTYKVKVKAMQGKFTETGYGPESSAATVNPTLSFGISTSSINFGNMIVNTVNTSPQNITVNFSTNASSGGTVYVSGSNGGMRSAASSYTINSVLGDLSSLGEGFGAQGVAGGTLTTLSPYNGGTDNVGIVNSSIRGIFSTNGPIAGGTGIFMLKSKPSSTAPPATDYTELLTVIAAGSF